MKIMLMDGMGGGVGKALAEQLRNADIDCEVIAVGTNSIATSGMMKAGSMPGATGENAVVYNASQADVIIGPIGIILPNAMYGEITPIMAQAVSQSNARKILIPIPNDRIYLAGMEQKPLSRYVQDAMEECIRLARKETVVIQQTGGECCGRTEQQKSQPEPIRL